MKIVLFVVVMLLAGVASANPWVVCDTQPLTDGFAWTMDSAAWVDTAYGEFVGDDGSHFAHVAEIGWVTPGDHSMLVKAFNSSINPETGKRYESEVVPFSFTRPAPPLPPNGGKLIP
jgi:hypothetical protein